MMSERGTMLSEQIGKRDLRFKLPMTCGDDVAALQAHLVKAGLLKPRHADGRFNLMTRRGLMRLERAHELPERGEVPQGRRSAILHFLRNLLRRKRPDDMAVVDGQISAPRRKPPSLISEKDLDEAQMQRIIVHWTAGTYQASELDRRHYHFMIQGDGQVIAGHHRPADNVTTGDRHYAAHTKGTNTGSIGVALCAMAGAQERPFRPGSHPFSQSQWHRMTQVVAQLCDHYQIPVTARTVLGHGEVQKNLHIRQNGKWDPLVLPFNPSLSKAEVGDKLRADVLAALTVSDEDELVQLDAVIQDVPLPGAAVTYDVREWIAVAPLVDQLSWTLLDPDAGGGVIISAGQSPVFIPSFRHKDPKSGAETLYLSAQELAEALDLGISLTNKNGTDLLVLSGMPGGSEVRHDDQRYRLVTVRRGDTLTRIALRVLGSKDRWREIRSHDGEPYDDETARHIAAGNQVQVPVSGAAGGGQSLPSAGAAAINLTDIEAAAKGIAEVVRHRANAERARQMVPPVLKACAEMGVSDPAHIAYMLATAEHEGNFGQHMTEIWKSPPSAAQRGYQGKYGNDQPGDGQKYRGRGFVQLTFKANYQRFGDALGIDLVDDPDRAAEPLIASKIMILGMTKLGYRSANLVLSRYGFGDDFQFEQARAIINNDVDKREQRYDHQTRGVATGRQAERYYEVLKAHL